MVNKKTEAMAYYPAFLNVKGKKCVVVGGGNVALRKVKILLSCGANITVVSPDIHPELIKLAERNAIRVFSRPYEPGDLKDAVIVIAATDGKQINRKVVHEGKEEGALVNVADDPGVSDFITPSFFRRGDLIIAISTGGRSPALARTIKTRLEQNFGKEYASLLSLIGEVRSRQKQKGIVVSPEAWQEALDLDLLTGLVRAGRQKEAKAVLMGKLEAQREGK